MTAPVLTPDGRAVIFDCETGQVLTVSVPTAIENVRLGAGRFVHGDSGEIVKAKGKAPAPLTEPVIPLTEPDVLPLPAGETGVNTPAPAPEPVAEQPADPLDHDGDGKKGGAKPAADDDAERAAVIAALREKGVKFFAGASTEKLKEKLASS